MRKIKLTVEYDGTHFFGFQIQKRARTVQSELESALKKLFQEKIKVIGAGRTDSGVHAEGQVAHFSTTNDVLPIFKIRLGLNRYLPEDLAVIAAEEVPPSFHAQFSAKRKRYEYRVLNSKARRPIERFRSFYFPYPLDLAKMKRTARLLSGKHDFRAFEASGGRRKHAVRMIRRLQVKKTGNIICFTVEADGFLYKMVRSIVGTLLEVGQNRLKLADFKRMITFKNRRLVGPTAPPQGLTLKQVIYR
ncbi:MAG: tRNA pseudouridine(38-40) synthase TruA [Candidatus Omnitrophica bacterium]|nr:tRNA pseudouridine(38-40) synthase TruA [Candidatus Omnitrophota bacterium]